MYPNQPQSKTDNRAHPQLPRPKAVFIHTPVLPFVWVQQPHLTACSQQSPLSCLHCSLHQPQLHSPCSPTSSHSGALEGCVMGPAWRALSAPRAPYQRPVVIGEQGRRRRLPAAVISDKPLQREVTAVLMFQERHTQPGVTHHLGYL